ncbi:MAG: FliM/FliN family flagellar motor C-terminal domain-containing protein [Pseudomonadota bacterium]
MSEQGETGSADLLKDVNMEVHVSVGRAFPSVETLMQLGPQSVLTLEQTVSDPVELFIGDKLIARGHLEEVEGDDSGQLAIRITAMGDPVAGLK